MNLIDTANALVPVIKQARQAGRVALDVESNGLFAYRPRVCTVQLAWAAPDGSMQVAIVDTLQVPPSELAPLLQDPGVCKVLHDLAFDARILFQEGIRMVNVRDTAVQAMYLGRPATGLASLLSTEFGLTVSKEMQASDWGRRPLTEESLSYLVNDVQHLLALEARLWDLVTELEVSNEVEAETLYRLENAYVPSDDERPAYVRIRGADGLDAPGKAALKELVQVREELAEQEDMPLFRIIADRMLVELAQRRPASLPRLHHLGGLYRQLQDPVALKLLAAIKRGLEKGFDPSEARFFEPPVFDREKVNLRKRIERRIQQWRKDEAQQRGVTEQVVLPGHCLRRLVSGERHSPDLIAQLPGLGQARAERYAEVLARMVLGVLEPAPVKAS